MVDKTKNKYSFGVGFNFDNKNSFQNQKTIGESDLKKLFTEPADGDLRLKVTKSKTKLDKESNMVIDPTKGETQLELGKNFLGIKFKKKFSKGSEIKINEVASALKKASKLHAGQAKTLESIKLTRGGGIAIRGTKFTGVK